MVMHLNLRSNVLHWRTNCTSKNYIKVQVGRNIWVKLMIWINPKEEKNSICY